MSGNLLCREIFMSGNIGNQGHVIARTVQEKKSKTLLKWLLKYLTWKC